MSLSKGAWGCVLLLAALVIAAAVGLGWPGGVEAWVAFIGRLAGVGGLACMLMAGVLSVRIPGLDRFFGGLVTLWQLHHRLGLAAFVLLLAHPPLMALAAWPHGVEALGEVLLPPPGDWVLWSGWLALAAMLIFLAPSFQLFGRPGYQRWKALHFLAGVALLGGLVHTVPLTRSFPAPWLVWGSFGGLALAVFLWRATLARPLMRRDYQIIAREVPAERVVELSLEPVKGKRLAFRPGQFVYLTPLDDALDAGRGEEHPYTISSAPGEDRLRIAIKDLGDASSALQAVRTPSLARVEGPYGDFLPDKLRDKPQLWVGGGIGLTPFVSAARAMRAGLSYGPVDLIYCANDGSRAYFLEELRDIAAEVPDFHVHVHYFQDMGPLSGGFITEHCADAARRHWFICGPVPLIRLASAHGRAAGVPLSRIHTEEFDFL